MEKLTVRQRVVLSAILDSLKDIKGGDESGFTKGYARGMMLAFWLSSSGEHLTNIYYRLEKLFISYISTKRGLS